MLSIGFSISRILVRSGIVLSLVLMLCLISAAVLATQDQSRNPDTGAKTWAISDAGVHFSLTQILPDQIDAFYVNRGFTLDQIAPFTTSCVFMTVLRNDAAPGSIHYLRSDWQVIVDGKPHRFKTVAEWLEFYRAKKIAKPALLAFQWAQFPPEQEYQPGGDWNQGMLSVGLSAGQSFDITAHWDVNGQAGSTTLKGVECAN